MERHEHTDSLFAVGVNLANDAATAELADRIDGAGVRSIVLKGPALRHWLYGWASDRISMDIDLLISWDDLEATEVILKELGYEYLGIDTIGPGRPHCRVWHMPSSGVMLELHRRIAGIEAHSDEAWEILSGEAEEMQVEGSPIRVLSTRARVLHVALHAAQHGKQSAKTMGDLALALEKLPEETWHEASALAARLRALPAFVAGLRLAPEGEALLERLALASDVPTEVLLRASSAPPLAGGLDWLTNVPGVRGKAVFLASQLIPPPGYMRICFPFARRHRLGLALAYFWRPVWLGLSIGPALRAWLRARRTRSSGASGR